IDVSAWGASRASEVNIDNNRLVAHGLTLAQVLAAINQSNANVGGQTVNFGEQSAIVRGIGLIQSLDDLRKVVVSQNKGAPVTVGDVAEVRPGNLIPQGIAGQDNDDDIVQGIVLMFRGAESLPTLKGVDAEIDKINNTGVLPPGVKIERIYDRGDLIKLTTHTVIHNLIVGILLIFFIQWAFLGNLRSAIIVAATIPFALCFAVLILVLRGESANLLSVGALDFGLIVDATVIMVENIYRHLAERSHALDLNRGRPGIGGKISAILQASSEVNRGILFAALIIIASFLPLFTLPGVEGHIFGPMAKTYAYAILGGLIATFTVSPVLSAMLLPDKLAETETHVVRFLRKLYQPAIRYALANKKLAMGGALVSIIVTCVAAYSLGLEFLPHLEEGNFWIRAEMPGSVSLEASNGYVNEMRKLIASYPEVETVVSQHGRPDDGTDATGFFNAEFFAPLKPMDEWPDGLTKDQLAGQMSAALGKRFPGVEFNFSQYIQDNVEEASSGVKGSNSIKLFGPDLQTLENIAAQIKNVMAQVPGIADLGVFHTLGQPTVRIDVDRDKAARYGLTSNTITEAISAAIGGEQAGDLFEKNSDRHFPILVRLQVGQRSDLDAIRRITVGADDGKGGVVQVPLGEVTNIHFVSGASFIYREHQERYLPVKFSVRDRDLGSTVMDAQQRIAEKIKLPPGYYLEWAGELGNLNDAIARLQLVIPVSIGLILFLLFINFGAMRDMALAASVMPMAMIGGVLTLFFTGTPFSISAAIGFIALLGISVMDGIIVLTAFNQRLDEGMERGAALMQACENSLRPVVMTCVVAAIGLLPAALSNGIGSQVQKPLALVVVGGMLLAPILILLVLPVMIDLFSKRRGLEPEQGRESGEEAAWE
ncbi:MAG: CusA/CzcA family heavy metal efflux RND transporter, partial [Gallionellaceae bacterium]|nr:CusA/CzcA family heavy metal efflux RND transporter [Gallionellaceae bacterium]